LQLKGPASDILAKVVGDPSNQGILAIILVGVVVVVAKSRAITRTVSRPSRPNPEE
jgi:hypothetical protein